MRFEVVIDCEAATLDEDEPVQFVVADILRDIANQLANDEKPVIVRDRNGRSVGKCEFKRHDGRPANP